MEGFPLFLGVLVVSYLFGGHLGGHTLDEVVHGLQVVIADGLARGTRTLPSWSITGP